MEVEKQTTIPHDAPKPPLAGIVYGDIAYWILLLGMLVAIIGMIIYLVSDGYVRQDCLLDSLWNGDTAKTIWNNCAGQSEIPEGHWYLGKLSKADGLAMGGIALGCLAAVVGMWGAAVAMFREKNRLFTIFALISAVVLTLSALGIIALEH